VSTLVSIDPTGAPVGPNVTVTATGTGFVDPAVTPPGSVLVVDGGNVTTTFVSATKLTTSLPCPTLKTVTIGVSDGTGTADFNIGLPDGDDGEFVKVPLDAGGTLTFYGNDGDTYVSTVVGTLG